MVYLVLDKSWKYKNDFYGSSAERRCYLVVWWYDRCHVSWKWQLKKKKWGFLSLTSWIEIFTRRGGGGTGFLQRGRQNQQQWQLPCSGFKDGCWRFKLPNTDFKVDLITFNEAEIDAKTSKKTLFLGILKLCSACSFLKNDENDSSCIQGHIPIHRPINALLIFMTALWMYE